METAVLHQVTAIYFPILAVVGVPGNLMAIVILCQGKCGLSKCITRYLVAMAAADLLVGVTNVLLTTTIGSYFPLSFLTVTPVCSVNIALFCAATVASVWFTVAFTFDRFIAICCQKLRSKYCTETTAGLVIGLTGTLSCLTNIPWYFAFRPEYIMDNVSRGCDMKPTFYRLPMWIAFDISGLVLTPCIPFFLLLLFNSLTVRDILEASRIRRGLRRRSNVANDKDPEMENRRKSIVLLFSISGTFMLLWSTKTLYVIAMHFAGNLEYAGSDFETVGFMLQVLSSCTNTSIYVLTQRKFRRQLKNAMTYPVNSILKFVKSRK